MHVIILLNIRSRRAARGGLRREIESACLAHGISAEIIECTGATLIDSARAAAGKAPPPEVIAVAGGDGSVSAVAHALAFGRIPMGIIPAGTYNHFARDLPVPLGVDAAVALLASHSVSHVDLGEVNGRRFVNNSAIGMYPALVTARDRQQRRSGWPKWLAQLPAAWRVAMRPRLVRATLVTGDGSFRVRTPLLFVGNNRYEASWRSGFRRETLTGGRLVAHVVRRQGRWTLAGLILRLVFGHLGQDDLETLTGTALTVRTARRRSRVALDGEVYLMLSPFHYRILPRALPVVVPRRT